MLSWNRNVNGLNIAQQNGLCRKPCRPAFLLHRRRENDNLLKWHSKMSPSLFSLATTKPSVCHFESNHEAEWCYGVKKWDLQIFVKEKFHETTGCPLSTRLLDCLPWKPALRLKKCSLSRMLWAAKYNQVVITLKTLLLQQEHSIHLMARKRMPASTALEL